MKTFTASLATESNFFSPNPTSYQDYADTCLIRSGSPMEGPGPFVKVLALFQRRAEERGWQVIEGLCAFATPSGRTAQAVYESFRNEILGDLKAAAPVDIVLFALHGAMAAFGYDDCEGDLLARAREIVGPDVPIGVTLDPHCHITELMMKNATAMILWKTSFDHTDYLERADELFDIIVSAAEGEIRPVMSVFDCRMLDGFITDMEPMKSFMERITGLEGKQGVLSISVGHGFPWADLEDVGTKMLVITDDRPLYGAELAEKLGRELFANRGQLLPLLCSIDDGINKALALPDDLRPVCLCDWSDNPGGGAPGDATFLLRAMIERNVGNAISGTIRDSTAVQICSDAGEGAEMDLRLGGKIGVSSGQPLDLRVKVIKIAKNVTSRLFGFDWPACDFAAVRHGGIDIVLSTGRPCDVAGMDEMGLRPFEKDILTINSLGPYPEAAHAIHLFGPGATTLDFQSLPYTKIRRPKWPLDKDPFGAERS